MTGTEAHDASVFGSPTRPRQIERVTFSSPSDSSSLGGEYAAHSKPFSSPSLRPVYAAHATAVAASGDDDRSVIIRSAISGVYARPLRALRTPFGISAILQGFAAREEYP